MEISCREINWNQLTFECFILREQGRIVDNRVPFAIKNIALIASLVRYKNQDNERIVQESL